MAKRTGAQTNLANGDDVDTEVGTRGELNAAAVVRQAAEVVLRTVGVLNVDHAAIVDELRGIVQPSPATERVTREVNADPGLELAQWLFTQHDFRDKPYLRVFGRVMEILLNHRRRQTCTAGDVFRVFLVEIPSQLEEHHRQTLRFGSDFDITRQPARRTFNGRMKRLRRYRLAQATTTRESGRDEDYVLTARGQTLFDGWPNLADIPGLTYEGAATPEERPRHRS
jgi:hypothetical protein